MYKKNISKLNMIFLLLLVIVLVLVVFKNEIFILIEDVSNSFYRTQVLCTSDFFCNSFLLCFCFIC